MIIDRCHQARTANTLEPAPAFHLWSLRTADMYSHGIILGKRHQLPEPPTGKGFR